MIHYETSCQSMAPFNTLNRSKQICPPPLCSLGCHYGFVDFQRYFLDLQLQRIFGFDNGPGSIWHGELLTAATVPDDGRSDGRHPRAHEERVPVQVGPHDALHEQVVRRIPSRRSVSRHFSLFVRLIRSLESFECLAMQSWNDVRLFIFGSMDISVAPALIITGELVEFTAFIQRHPFIIWDLMTFSIASALGQVRSLLLVFFSVISSSPVDG